MALITSYLLNVKSESRMAFVFPSTPTNNADKQLNCFLSTLICFVLFTLNGRKVTRRNQVFFGTHFSVSKMFKLQMVVWSLCKHCHGRIQRSSHKFSDLRTQTWRRILALWGESLSISDFTITYHFMKIIPATCGSFSCAFFIFLKCFLYFKQSETKVDCLQTHFSSAPAPKNFQFVLGTKIFDDKNKVRIFQFVDASWKMFFFLSNANFSSFQQPPLSLVLKYNIID